MLVSRSYHNSIKLCYMTELERHQSVYQLEQMQLRHWKHEVWIWMKYRLSLKLIDVHNIKRNHSENIWTVEKPGKYHGKLTNRSILKLKINTLFKIRSYYLTGLIAIVIPRFEIKPVLIFGLPILTLCYSDFFL
jgi:hypothetical protein